MKQKHILIAGAGIFGLWHALTLSQKDHQVTLVHNGQLPGEHSASAAAGAMLAPWCEGEDAKSVVVEMGITSLPLWKKVFPRLTAKGTLVVSSPRDAADLRRFATHTDGHARLSADEIEKLEPALTGRFRSALYYENEAHMQPQETMLVLENLAKKAGASFISGVQLPDILSLQELNKSITRPTSSPFTHIIDCRGLGAKTALQKLGKADLELRGVRGEFAVVQTTEISFSRPIRLLHPRFPLYIVPWNIPAPRPSLQSMNRFMVGATVIENSDRGPVKLRSALELLGAAFSVHPAFGEAEIVSFETGIRPAFSDNIPKIIAQSHVLHVNGAHRHGYLTAPALARLTARWLDNRKDTLINDAQAKGVWIEADS